MPITTKSVTKVCVEVEEKLWKRFRLKLLQEDLHASEFIREAINQYLNQKAQ